MIQALEVKFAEQLHADDRFDGKLQPPVDQDQAAPAGLPEAAALRGSTMVNSVNWPGCVSTAIVPACCLTTMSWLMESPSPVPSPAGLVVKNGLNILSLTSGGMPVPLSRDPDLNAIAEISGRRDYRRLEIGAVGLRLALVRRVKPVGNDIK